MTNKFLEYIFVILVRDWFVGSLAQVAGQPLPPWAMRWMALLKRVVQQSRAAWMSSVKRAAAALSSRSVAKA
jgi:hypothetical protein